MHEWVPQGSTFGSLLFLKYMNDLTDNLSNPKLFADDTSLFFVVCNVKTSADEVSSYVPTSYMLMCLYIYFLCWHVPLCLKLCRVYVHSFFTCLCAYNHSFLPSVIKQATSQVNAIGRIQKDKGFKEKRSSA